MTRVVKGRRMDRQAGDPGGQSSVDRPGGRQDIALRINSGRRARTRRQAAGLGPSVENVERSVGHRRKAGKGCTHDSGADAVGLGINRERTHSETTGRWRL